MGGPTVKKFKWFWHDQDAEQEQWLRARACRGLHLKGIDYFQQWTFDQGAAADMVYRLDYTPHAGDPHYRGLFEDAGWEHVMGVLGWQYWRTPASNPAGLEIFTDTASKIAKYRRMLTVALALLAALLILLGNVGWQRLATEPSVPFQVLIAGALAILVVAPLRLWRRIRRLRTGASSG